MSTVRPRFLPLLLAAALAPALSAADFTVTITGGNPGSLSLTSPLSDGSTTWNAGSTDLIYNVTPAVSDTATAINLISDLDFGNTALRFTNAGTLSTATFSIFTSASKSLTLSQVESGAGTLVNLTPTSPGPLSGAITFNNAGGLILVGSGRFAATGLIATTAPLGLSGTTLSTDTLALTNAADTASNLVLGGTAVAPAILRHTGATEQTSRLFSVKGAAEIHADGAGAITFANTGAIVFAGAAGTTDTLTLSGTNSSGVHVLSALVQETDSTVAVTKDGDATWTLANAANTYTGATAVKNGTLIVSKLSDAGIASSLGAASADAANLILGSVGNTSATLRYTGAGDTTNRLFTLAGDATIQNTGAGALRFTGTGTLVNNGGATLTLDGTNTGDNELASRLTAGNLTKTGAGKWILTGDNTYTGPTTVSAGTLQIGNGGATGALGSGSVHIATGATLAFNRTGTLLVSAPITGAGTLIQQGLGTVILGDDNSMSGNIAVTAGTLQVGNGGTSGSLGSAVVSINAGATLAFDRVGTVTVANTLSGTGDLTQRGSGTTILTGANTISGTVTVTSGTLQVGNGGTAGALGTAAVANNATLVFNRSDALTFAGDYSGTGTLEVKSGALTLTGANTGTGATVIRSGATLAVGNGGTSGTLASGSVTNDGALAFNRTDTVLVASVISGTGTLTQNGTGTLTLASDNSYSGGTTVSAGTLQVGNGGLTGSLGSGDVTVNTSATLAYKNSGFITLTNTLSGAGALEQRGTGTLVLAGTNALTGAVTVSSGTLQVGNGGTSGSLGTGAVSISSGATLAFDKSGTTTVANTLSGSGDLTQRGSGTTILTGANTISGTVTVASGTLQVGNGGTAGALGTAAVANNATLVFNRSDALTFAGDYSGTGTLEVKSGALTLTGANTGTGATVIRSGATLAVGNGGTSGTLASGSVTNDGALAFNRTDTVLVASVISGTGTLTKNGTGTLTLASDNSYSGGTSVSAGTLQVGNGGFTGALGSGDITVNAGATLAYKNSGFITLTNTLSGAGAFEQRGTGTLVLSGSNSLTGGISISAGILQIGNGGTAGTLGSGAVVNNATLIFNRASGLTVANVISGTGELVQSGSGTITLTGDNTYTGATTVSSGALQIGDGHTTGRLGTGTVTNNATLIFNRADAVTVANTITGNGSIIQRGTGTLTLTGANNSTGTVSVESGTLEVASVAPLGTGSVSVAHDATLSLHHTDAQSLARGFTGAGTLVLQGAGSTRLVADLTLPDLVSVKSGHTLDLGGRATTAPKLDIDSGATLRGTGTLGGSLTNAGTFAPGNSPGIVTLFGDFTNTATGTVSMEIGGVSPGTQYDQIHYTGQAILQGGTLTVSLVNGFAPKAGDTFHLLVDDNPSATPSVIGAFTTVNLPVFGYFSDAKSTTGLDFTVVNSLAALPGVQVNDASTGYAAALSALGATDPRAAAIMRRYTLSGASAAAVAIENGSPQGLVSPHALVIDESRELAAVLRGRAADRRGSDAVDAALVADEASRKFTAYASAHSVSASAGNGEDDAPFDHALMGGLVGLEYRARPAATAYGAALAYDTGHTDLHNGGGKVEQTRAGAALYATGDVARNAFVTGGVFAGTSDFTAKRNTELGRLNGSASGSDYGATADFGWHASPNHSVEITPALGLTYTHSTIDGFSESGNAFAVKTGSSEADSLRARVGTNFDWKTKAGGTRLFLGAGLAYEHELMDTHADYAARFADGTGGALTGSPRFQEGDSITLSPHVGAQLSNATAVTLGYRFEMGFNGTTTTRLDLGLRHRF